MLLLLSILLCGNVYSCLCNASFKAADRYTYIYSSPVTAYAYSLNFYELLEPVLFFLRISTSVISPDTIATHKAP